MIFAIALLTASTITSHALLSLPEASVLSSPALSLASLILSFAVFGTARAKSIVKKDSNPDIEKLNRVLAGMSQKCKDAIPNESA